MSLHDRKSSGRLPGISQPRNRNTCATWSNKSSLSKMNISLLSTRYQPVSSRKTASNCRSRFPRWFWTRFQFRIFKCMLMFWIWPTKKVLGKWVTTPITCHPLRNKKQNTSCCLQTCFGTNNSEKNADSYMRTTCVLLIFCCFHQGFFFF